MGELRRGKDYPKMGFLERTPEQREFDEIWQNGLEQETLAAYKRWATYRNGLKAAAEVAYMTGKLNKNDQK